MKMKKIYFEKLENFCGLDWLTLENCPMYDDPQYGQIIDLKMNEMTKLAATQIILSGVPLRGIEINILRTALGYSYEEFSREFRISAGTVFKWEKAKYDYVSMPNDLMVRLFAAEKFKCNIPTNFSSLISAKTPQKPITFRADFAA